MGFVVVTLSTVFEYFSIVFLFAFNETETLLVSVWALEIERDGAEMKRGEVKPSFSLKMRHDKVNWERLYLSSDKYLIFPPTPTHIWVWCHCEYDEACENLSEIRRREHSTTHRWHNRIPFGKFRSGILRKATLLSVYQWHDQMSD